MGKLNYKNAVERWSVFEVSWQGPKDGNPFISHMVSAVFHGEHEEVHAEGFYDGDGVYKVRFMPSFEGKYSFFIKKSYDEEECIPNHMDENKADEKIRDYDGTFQVTPAKEGNHGPVRVANTYHMAYEDGTPYYSIGTTCYVWNLQSDEMISQTLETLKNSAFNKIRFCIFPKHYDYNLGEPRSYPYEGTPMESSVLTKENFQEYTGKKEGNNWDFTRFNTEHFAHIEYCIEELLKLGIEADLIVMHPYDRWGFSNMTKEEDDRYWTYVLARFSAYRNVWWSLANEYDLMEQKTLDDWERYAQLICEKDPYHHLRSIHNCRHFYDYSRPWITHCSIQRTELYRSAELTNEWRERFKKPIVLDEISYEGNIQHGWGNIGGEEMVRRFWETAVRGGYPGHGETYMNDKDVLWWSHGGKLYGESHKRFAFLHEIMLETPGIGLMPYQLGWDEVCAVPEESYYIPGPAKEYFLIYFSFMQPSFREYHFDDETKYHVQVIDTWNMTREDKGIVQGKFRVELPGKPYIAIQLKRVM